jgi:uncharacterized membrane protein
MKENGNEKEGKCNKLRNERVNTRTKEGEKFWKAKERNITSSFSFVSLQRRGCLVAQEKLFIIIIIIILLFTGAYSPGRTFGLPFRGFLITHTDTR